MQDMVAAGEADALVAEVVGNFDERVYRIATSMIPTGLWALLNAMSLGKPGSEIQAPMALVILCGLVTSTALNMIVVPALYLRFGQAVRIPAGDQPRSQARSAGQLTAPETERK